MASTSSRVCFPRATSGWLVTTTSWKPADRRSARASGTPGQDFQIVHGFGGKGKTVAQDRAVDHPVAVQEDGARHYRCDVFAAEDSHFVGFAFSFGCDTIRCQITAWNDSVWGVMLSGFTVGTSTQASATRAVYPPSRPTIPTTRAPTSFASCRAVTMLGLMFFSRLPPPTESTNTASFFADAARLQPLDEHGGPPLVVGARRELGDVVGGRIGLDPDELAEVVHRVGAAARASADAEEEEPSPALAHVDQHVHHLFHGGRVDPRAICAGLGQVLLDKVHGCDSFIFEISPRFGEALRRADLVESLEHFEARQLVLPREDPGRSRQGQHAPPLATPSNARAERAPSP